jgi:hypothetical protein
VSALALVRARTLLVAVVASWWMAGCVTTEEASEGDDREEAIGTALSAYITAPLNVPFSADDDLANLPQSRAPQHVEVSP